MGYVVRDMPAQLPEGLVRKLLRAETATIGHVRTLGFADREIQPILPGTKIAGTAVTLAFSHQDACMIHHALNALRPGDVLVIDTLGDDRYACWGGQTAAAGAISGAAGVIIDGAIADLTELRQHGFPVWARGPAPKTGRRHGIGGAMNVPIAIGGAAVLPGYAVLADENGVLFMPADEAEECADWAIARLAAEPELLRDMRAGGKMGELTGSSEQVRKNLSRWF
jgi:regulator of RNase E activity RraA